MRFARFAIYVLPDTGSLAEFGAAWLGWDARTGRVTVPPELPALPMPLAEMTEQPRKYGFHGTIKPPFRLADGQSEDRLRATFGTFCEKMAPVSIDGLDLAELGRFLALVPHGDTRALNGLAAATVREFDGFRATLTEAELAKRRHARLNPEQDRLLRMWGYPYVMEEFRFHLTLTGKLPKAKATALRTILEPILEPMMPTPFIVEALTLMGECEDGNFHRMETLPLTGVS